jgi:hypothetical protein
MPQDCSQPSIDNPGTTVVLRLLLHIITNIDIGNAAAFTIQGLQFLYLQGLVILATEL